MSTPHLEVRDLTVGYGDATVIEQASFDVEKGDVVAIVGSNGAGKTTLLSAIAGLVPVRSGSIRFEGQDLLEGARHSLPGRGLVMVPEGGRLFPFMSVLENLELGAFSGGNARARAERMAEMYEIFPILGTRRHQLAGRLSGGERQMCAVARALMSRPRLLLLDEPSVGLSPLMTQKLLEEIGHMARREGLSVVIVEQRVTEVLEMADYAHILDHGHLVKSGPAAQMRSDRQIQETYMGL